MKAERFSGKDIPLLTEIPVTEFPGIRIGQVEDREGGTGITVVLSEDPKGMPAGLRVGGGGPATRETGILDPVAAAQRIHAAVLGGGSAYGLDAAGGVMRYLEEKGIGVEVRGIHVPLVTQVDLFDLPVGDPQVRPDQKMGYAACVAAQENNYRDGCYGAGCGATIGKYAGGEHAMKSGIGSCVLRQGKLLVGAIVAVNAFGDIYDRSTGQKIAGAHDEAGRFYTVEEMLWCLRRNAEIDPRGADSREGEPGEKDGRTRQLHAGENSGRTETSEGMASNTTIGIVFTNASFRKPALCKIAAMAHDGFAASICPVHQSGDGDSIIALSICRERVESEETESCGESEALSVPDALTDTVGSMAALAVSRAIVRGVRSARSAYGYPALCDPRFSSGE